MEQRTNENMLRISKIHLMEEEKKEKGTKDKWKHAKNKYINHLMEEEKKEKGTKDKQRHAKN